MKIDVSVINPQNLSLVQVPAGIKESLPQPRKVKTRSWSTIPIPKVKKVTQDTVLVADFQATIMIPIRVLNQQLCKATKSTKKFLIVPKSMAQIYIFREDESKIEIEEGNRTQEVRTPPKPAFVNDDQLEDTNQNPNANQIGLAETMENEETQYNDAKQNTEALEKINFNTMEDEEEKDLKKEVVDVDESAQEIDLNKKSNIDHNRSSTIVVTEGAMDEAHDYVQGMIKSIKHQHKTVREKPKAHGNWRLD